MTLLGRRGSVKALITSGKLRKFSAVSDETVILLSSDTGVGCT